MQEDKLAKEIAKSLKKHQEESFHPYEIGAWEAFDKKRTGGFLPWWKLISTGIAASLVMGMAWWWMVQEPSSELELVPEVAQVISGENLVEENSESIGMGNESSRQANKTPSTDPNEFTQEDLIEKQSNLVSQEFDAIEKQTINDGDQSANAFQSKNPTGLYALSFEKKDRLNELPYITERPIFPNQISGELAERPLLERSVYLPKSNLAVLQKDKSTSPIKWEVGLSPAFGSSNGEQSAEIISSSLGMGLAMALGVTEKLQIGTGLAFSALNQESQFTVTPANALASSMAPSNDKILLSQAQMDIPFFVQYPLTRNQSLSIRAGFSNIISLDQEVDLESIVNRQVVVAGDGINSSSIRQESVVQTTNLPSSNQQFYPLATLNFGLNIRVLQSKQMNYLLMPFYNLPLTDFSGFVENPGMVGASFKVNFMSGKK
ncbi:MAG: hypothetical protein HWE15_03795 [Algoriphagus sp.]|uniref:hypothetical protein n=1 Tax=Algoriphagus sp. TaxID=1872435 RepID=UPI0017FF8A62|nr:hypothetical protein [Algoriphagus sp.]NVJ85400.1 hypothetical protein [Algoriphagus sp.]